MAQPEAVELTLLGTGTLLPSGERASPAHHVRWRGLGILLDCGAGALQGLARAGIDWAALTHVVLTHYHTDHNGALASLMWALTNGPDSSRRRPLGVVGPPGLEALRRGLEIAHGAFISGTELPVVWHETSRQASLELSPHGAVLRCHPTPHTHHSVAWRLDTDAGSVGYTGDTGPSEHLGEFFAGCDVLVCECSSSDDDPREGHLTPSEVARLARRAEPGRVVLTHAYPPHAPAALAASAAARAPGIDIVAGHDGMRVRIGAGGRRDPRNPSR